MAIAVEALPAIEAAEGGEATAAAAAPAARAPAARPRAPRVSAPRGGSPRSSGPSASQFLPSSVSGNSSLLPRLITAAFLGLLVLEAVSYITGRYFNYNLTTPLKPAAGDQTYHPLYTGQQVGDSAHVNPPALPFGPADRNSAQGNTQFGTPGLKLNPGTAGQ